MYETVIPKPSFILRPFDAVFLNFAVLHTFLGPGNPVFPQLTTNIYFERMIEKEIDAYLQVAKFIFIIAPPKVCEQKYSGSYREIIDYHFHEFLHNSTLLLQSKYKMLLAKSTLPWMIADESSNNYTIPLQKFNLTDYNKAYEFTRNHTLTHSFQ